LHPPEDDLSSDAPERFEAPEEVCLCFHVPIHKIVKFVQLERPRVASQCSECFNAGTGCGWCIPFLEKLFEEVTAGNPDPHLSMDVEEYRARRGEHLKRIKETRPREKVSGPVSGMKTDLISED
jgi:NAD(P)H-nitrite reductase large subunit